MTVRETRLVAGFVLALVGITTGGCLAGAIAIAASAAPMLPTAIGCLVGGIVVPIVVRAPAITISRRMLIVWGLAASLALVNTARVTIFAADPQQMWASVFPPMPESGRHQCFAAYVRAGELAALGHADLWNQDAYAQGKHSQVRGLAGMLADPYEYPPVLAAAARVAVAATDDYQLIRVAWFGASALAFWLAFLALARWAGGRAHDTALLCAPALALSTPLLFCLQWGQAHLIVLAAAVAGMLLLERGRRIAGASLLAFAIAVKIFPGLVLVYLAVRRRWGDVLATLGALAVLALASAVILGPATWHAYITHQLPAMASGQAFEFTDTNPDNYSLYGLGFKLAALGLRGGHYLAHVFSWAWTLVALGLAVVAGRREHDRAHTAIVWLGLLCVATLRSPYAPLYTGVGTLWVLAMARGVVPRYLGLFITAWILLQGFPPVGGNALNAALSLPSQLVTIAVAILAARD
ncbi:MAG TPA: glycosyltransferase family 87 protein [Kofleriaceae bacterium]|nr:glycosyltransferase family 87 protein [Kofleriaceae bacterium]